MDGGGGDIVIELLRKLIAFEEAENHWHGISLEKCAMHLKLLRRLRVL